MYNKEQLHFRRQFFFTNKEIKPFKDWLEVKVMFKNNESTLIHHPDLEYTSNNGTLNIILLGYILDPFHTSASNQDIVNELSGCANLQEALCLTDMFNGRYVMIIGDDKSQFIINDATASKQVYYTFKDGFFGIGSTPNIITSFIDCEITNNQELLDYLYSDRYINLNKSWFGTETSFKDLFMLLPNHSLDLHRKKINRFWPIINPSRKNTKESVKYIADIMRGTIESASNRFKLHCSLTGGWDSRMMLAAAKTRIKDIEFYSFKSDDIVRKNKWDLIIPKRLKERFGLNYNVIELDGKMPDKEFMEVFASNSIFNRNVYAEVYYKYLQNGHDKKMNVTGVMGDQILRIFYRFDGKITAERFADKCREPSNPYVVKSIRQWMNEVEPLIPQFDYHLIDWFNWEHYFANWGGLAATEHDIARDELRFFNCRELLTTFMRFDKKLRYRDNPKAHRMIVNYNWKELLREKVEPSNIQHRKLKKFLRFINLERTADYLYRIMKYKIKKL